MIVASLHCGKSKLLFQRSAIAACLLLFFFIATNPVSAEDSPANFGIPGSSPGVFWPRGMGIEALSPNNLYPNGPQFGLATTAGGFGMTGSGPFSGLGLEQRTVSPLERQSMAYASSFARTLDDNFSRELQRSNALFGNATAGRFFALPNSSANSTFSGSRDSQLISPYALPTADSVLQDKMPGADSILFSGGK